MNNIKAIYKIENMINHHIYIGQSNNPERRWKEHCTNNNNYISLINSAIQKYGKENFSFEIIGWFEDYNEKEKFYINFYNTIRPNGYNISPGGEEPPVLKGENHPNCKITSNIAKQIKEDLKDWNIPRKNIIKNIILLIILFAILTMEILGLTKMKYIQLGQMKKLLII